MRAKLIDARGFWRGMRRIATALSLLAAPLSAVLLPSASAQIPAAINYQGRLTDALGSPLTNGFYVVQFKIWDDPTRTAAANYIWGRSFPIHVVTGGLFNVLLTDDGGEVGTPRTNDVTAAFTGPNRYLGLTIVANPQGNVPTPAEISPRQQLVSAPYAIQAQTANQVMPGSIVTASLQDGSVTTPILANQSVTADKLANGAVSSSALNIDGTLYMNGNSLQLRSQPPGGRDNSDYLAWATDASVDGSRLYGWSGGILGSSSGGAKPVLAWRENGSVGIGTTTPGKALLEIEGSQVFNINQYAYLNSTPPVPFGSNPGHNSDDNQSRLYSVYADQRIAAIEFNAHSDARIKKVMGRSAGANDLQTLLAFEIMDYTLIDTVAKGQRPYKKVIGQQVEGVFPQAVSHTSGVVPDIFRRGEAREGWVHISESTATLVQVGDRVRLITDHSHELHEVLEISSDKFRISEKLDGPVFVYGREVDDYRVVDYEAIAMLNVSATQEIYRRLQEAERALTEARQQRASLEARLIALEDREAATTARFGEWERRWKALAKEPGHVVLSNAK